MSRYADTMKQDHEKTVLELKSKHDQANALHQEEINRIKANHENCKIHELSQEIKQAKENHAAEIDSLSMVQKSTIDNIKQSKLNEVAVLNKLHAESNEKIQIAEANQKKQICNAMILKWKAKNILYGFRTWKNYVALCKVDTMKQDHEKTVLELKSKHDQANALHQEEITKLKVKITDFKAMRNSRQKDIENTNTKVTKLNQTIMDLQNEVYTNAAIIDFFSSLNVSYTVYIKGQMKSYEPFVIHLWEEFANSNKSMAEKDIATFLEDITEKESIPLDIVRSFISKVQNCDPTDLDSHGKYEISKNQLCLFVLKTIHMGKLNESFENEEQPLRSIMSEFSVGLASEMGTF